MTDDKREAKIEACVVEALPDGFSVTSPSGKTYRVRREFGRYHCSCPARVGSCVHLAAVERWREQATGTGI